MSEPRRLDVPSIGPADADRGEQIEALLVAGLDCYFEGRYEEAIHVWTRVLFLDRAHARARAYIDRARSAQAERHRRADQMLHETGRSLEAGDTERARQLLREAVDAAGDDERAADLRVRLERLELARPGTEVRHAQAAAVVDAVPLRRRLRPDRWPVVAGMLALVGGAAIALWGLGRGTWLDLRESPPPVAVLEPFDAAAAPSSSEVTLIRAETLFSGGRPAEALRLLDGAELDVAYQPAADRLRARIQQVLLALAGGPPTRASEAEAGAP